MKVSDFTPLSFNARNHAETVQMSLADFERLEPPKIGSFARGLY